MASGFVGEIRRDKIEPGKGSRNASGINYRGSLSIDDFRADPRYSGDGNRIDLAYALYAFRSASSFAALTGIRPVSPNKALRLTASLLGAAPLAFGCPSQETGQKETTKCSTT